MQAECSPSILIYGQPKKSNDSKEIIYVIFLNTPHPQSDRRIERVSARKRTALICAPECYNNVRVLVRYARAYL